jgi:hypothetical protein
MTLNPIGDNMTLARSTTTALLFTLGAGSALAGQPEATSPPPAVAAAAKDPSAMALLKRMSDRLRSAKTFTVRGRASQELPVAGGTLATFFTDYETAVRRPDGLAARRSGDMSDFRFVYDGKSMTVLAPGKWGTTSAPATIDAMLPAAGKQGGLDMPFDELLVADPYTAITAGVTEAVRAGPATVRGKKVEHVVLSSATLRLEYWIDPGTALPARSLVVYIDHPLQPHFTVEFDEWALDPKLPDATFQLPKPQGAAQADFRDAAQAFR